MFESSLLDSAAGAATLGRRAPWTTVVSFTIEGLLLAVLLLLPFLLVPALPPPLHLGSLRLYAPGDHAITVVPTPAQNMPRARSAENPLITPPSIPIHIFQGRVEARPLSDPLAESLGPIGAFVGTGDGVPGMLPAPVIDAPRPVEHLPAPPARIRVSDGVTAGLLVHSVAPLYPQLARQARVGGDVVLHAEIGRDGRIQNLRAVSGHPMLVESALEAVRQWRYRPYLLNGQPVEVETQIKVSFHLER